jgi:glycosyltransferase involved in cell wall biosynthesis
MNSGVVWMPAGRDACALYRLYIPHLHTPNSMFVYNEFGMYPDSFAQCRVAVVQRLYSQTNFNALGVLKQMGLKLVYDLDDDMWSVPSYNPAHLLFRKLLPGFHICAVQAHAITVSTEHLKLMVRRELGKECPPIFVAENSMDFNLFRPVSPEYRLNRNGRVVVGWAGTNTHSGDVKKVFDLVPALLDELPQMDFELVGLPMPETWKRFGDRIRTRDYIPVAEFQRYWASWQWDVALAPLERNKFNLSKSSIKMLEASTLGIPCVASRIASYEKFARYSKELPKYVMADSGAEWKRKIRDLVVDKGLRESVGAEMLRVGKEYYNIAKNAVRWQTVFDSVLGA